jgi:putative ABC transport system ATP-binding protein
LSSPVISVSGVNHYFQVGRARHQVLFDISVEIGQGEIVLLTGPSGSGKTTLLTLIGALRSVQEGSMQVLGHELLHGDESTLAEVRQRIGYIFQSHNLLDALTARENVEVALALESGLTRAELAARSTAALEAVGLGEKTSALPNELSGGQRQRVAIARALVTRPQLVLADEPTASLDTRTGREVVELLQKLASQDGVAVVLVTHDNRILDIADRIVTLEDGHLSSLMSSVTTDTQHMLGMVARDLRGGNLARRVANLEREELLSLMHEITKETQDLLALVDTIQGDTFRRIEEQTIVALAAKIGTLLQAGESRLYFVDHGSQSMWSLIQSDEGDYREHTIPLGDGIAGHVARTGQAVNTADASSLSYRDPQFDPMDPGSVLCFPIADSQGNVFAVIRLAGKPDGGVFDQEDERWLAEFTAACALVLESWWRMGCSCRAGGVGNPNSCCDN